MVSEVQVQFFETKFRLRMAKITLRGLQWSPLKPSPVYVKGRLFGTTDFPYLCTRHGILRVKRIRLIGTSVNPNQFQPSPQIPFKRTPLYMNLV